MRARNPMLSAKNFEDFSMAGTSEPMTVQGTVNKTLISTLLVFIGAAWTWSKTVAPSIQYGWDIPAVNPSVMPLMIGAGIAGFILAMVTTFKKEWAGYTTPAYALVEGVMLGAFSGLMERVYPGIVFQAILLTFGTLIAMLMLYKTGAVKVTDGFRRGVFAATGAICLVYLVSMVLSFFGVHIPMIHQGGMIGIIFSLVVVGIASANLLLDFDFIEQYARAGLPKYMEWFGAFGLLVTLIWLYMEILRLLSKLQSRN